MPVRRTGLRQYLRARLRAGNIEVSMKPLEEYPSEVRYDYTVDSGVSLNLAHGVWGGINPQGEIEMNFYLETDRLPMFSKISVEPDGGMGPEKNTYADDGEHVIIRRIHSRVLMNYQTARSLAEWLEEKLESLEMEENAFSQKAHDPGEVQQ